MRVAIIAEDAPGSRAARQAARPAHLARLEALDAEGRLVLAGPFPAEEEPAGFSGSLIVADFESLGAARDWAAADPYREAGVYASVDVKPFKQVFPGR